MSRAHFERCTSQGEGAGAAMGCGFLSCSESAACFFGIWHIIEAVGCISLVTSSRTRTAPSTLEVALQGFMEP